MPSSARPPAFRASQPRRLTLWNPNAAANWSVVLSPAFGAFLHAKNWEALDDPARARASRIWFWVCLVWLLALPPLVVFVPGNPVTALARLSGLGLLLGWYFALGRPQAREVKERHGTDYSRRPWGAPLGLAFGALLGYFLYAMGVGVIGYLAGAGPTRAERVTRPYRPLEVEGPDTLGRPLQEVLEGIDSARDPKAGAVFHRLVQQRLEQQHFAELAAYADFLRHSKARVPGGGWKLFRMVNALSECPGQGDPPEGAWREHLDRLRAWQAAQPDSPTPTVVLAEALIGWAWEARGSGFASTVTPAGWRLFRKRLAEAREVLESAPEAVRRCPMWHMAMGTVARGQGWDRGEYDRMFEQAVALEPGFLGFYANKATYLLPRWQGEPGDWERFARDAADRAGGDLGDEIYYWIVQNQMTALAETEIRADALIDWARVKRGIAVVDRGYGADRWTLNMACRIMAASCDREGALPLIERIGEDWDPSLWRDAQAYAEFRAWARREGKFAHEP